VTPALGADGPAILALPRRTRQWETPALSRPCSTLWEGAPVTRRLLLVAAVVAISGLAATPALEETAVGGWFVVPWDGGRGQGRPTRRADGATSDSGSAGRERWPATLHAKPRPHGHRPKVRRPKAKPDTPADTRRLVRNPHAPPWAGRR
jgi:hypothetical protein